MPLRVDQPTTIDAASVPRTNGNIIILGQYFFPEVAGTAQRLTELAIDLHRRGMGVKVITGQPTYRSSSPLPTQQVYEGVHIERLSVPYLDRSKPSRRAANALLFLSRAVMRLALSHDRDPLLIVTNPPVLPFVGWILKALRHQSYICLVQDIYPDIAERLGYLRPRGVIARLWDTINVRVYKEAEAVIVLGKCMARTIHNKYHSAAALSKVKVIHNWADPEFIRPRRKEDNWISIQQGTVEKLTVVYSGNMGLFHDMETLLRAARRLRNEQDIQFLFIGDGGQRQSVLNFIQKWDLANVHLLPYQPRENLPYSLTCGDISAVTLARGTEGLCMPGKLYTSLAAGQAILAVSGPDSELAEIIVNFDCGFRVDQGDEEGIVETVLRWRRDPDLLRRMQRNARRCLEEHFTKNSAVQEYYDLLGRR